MRPGTARPCVTEQPDPLRVALRPETPREIPAQLFLGTHRALSARRAHATARPGAAPAGRALSGQVQLAAPAPGSPAPSVPPADSPAPPRGGRSAASSAQSSAQRPPPIARRHRQRRRLAPPPALAPLRHREEGWQRQRSATGTRRRTGSGPQNGTRSAPPPRRARGPPAPPPRPDPAPARLPAEEGAGSPALPYRERSPSTVGPPLSPVPKGHTAFTPLRRGDSPFPWAAVPGLDRPFCEGIFPMSSLNLSCHSLRQTPLVLSLVTWEQRPSLIWLQLPLFHPWQCPRWMGPGVT